jgi:AraC-like DNA-binding protein
MNRFFERIAFADKPIVWDYKGGYSKPNQGFYHWHQICEVLVVHQGSGVVAFNSQTFEFKPGDLFFFQPFELHKVYANITPDEPYVRTVIHFDPFVVSDLLRQFPRRSELLTLLWKSPSAKRAFELSEQAGSIDDALAQYDEACSAGLGTHMEEIGFLFLQLLSSMQRSSRPVGTAGTAELRPQRYSEKIMNWLEARHTDEFDLGQLADELHLSKYYISRIFREETGSSITEYLTARRIMQACRLLETTALTVEQIGAEVGLPNTSHFILTFKKAVGLTPLKYRQAKRQAV